MTYAIRRDNGDVLYFDAITEITEVYTAQITKHPLASGGLISDHTIVENKRFSLKGILSDADFNLHRPENEGFKASTDKEFTNDTKTETPVVITSTASKWRSFLPEVVSQFTASTIPTVVVTEQEKIKTAKAVRNDLIAMLHNKESFTLVEYNTNFISRSWYNVVMVGLTFTENADTGMGLFPNIEMEEAQYTSVQNVKIAVKNKGRQLGTVKKKEQITDGDDAQNSPTNNSKKTSSILTGTTALGGN